MSADASTPSLSGGAMSGEQYLLVCLAEEAAEVAHAALKAARFGLDDRFHADPAQRPGAILWRELADLRGLQDLLVERIGDLDHTPFPDLVAAKIAKARRFMEYSRQRGRLS